MKKREPKLRLYTALLHLYPASFRQKYEEQLLLTAADILIDKPSAGAITLANLRLCFDTIGSALRVRATLAGTLEPQLRGTTPRSAFRSLLFALELSVLLTITFVWALQAVGFTNSTVYYFSHSEYTLVQQISQSLMLFILLAYLPIAIVLVARRAKLPLRAMLRWGYAIGLLGTISFILFTLAADRLIPVGVIATDVSDLPIVILYTAAYYAVARRFTRKLASRKLAVTA